MDSSISLLLTPNDAMSLIRRFNQSDRAGAAHILAIIGLMAIALMLRLMVWRWHELYPLGGDEQEYLNQALTLLRTRQYVELRLMPSTALCHFSGGVHRCLRSADPEPASGAGDYQRIDHRTAVSADRATLR